MTLCYFDIEINGKNKGRIVMRMFDSVTPKTCRNFVSLCTGDNPRGDSYQGCPFHRIIPE